MNLNEIFKQLKHVTPDPTYTAISKRAILGQSPKRTLSWGSLARVVESSATFALLSALLIFFFGGVSIFLEPHNVSLDALDPITLRAEAEAIDIQIHLTNLNYAIPTSTPGVSTISEAPSIPQELEEEVVVRAGDLGVPIPETEKAEPTIDEVLEILSQ